MRILHIIATLNPSAGGPAQSVRTLLTYGPLGYDAEVVTLDAPDAPYLQDIGFRVHPLGPVNTTYAYSSKLVPWLKANRHRFDGVVVNGLWNHLSFACWSALRGHVPYMVFTHGMLDPYFKRRYPLKHLKKAIYWYLAEYRVLRDAFRVLFTTRMEQTLAEQSFALHSWKPYVVPYGTSGPPAGESECRTAFREAVPEMQGKRFLLYLGRIHPKKGCDMLIDAFAQKAALDPDLHLLMAGPDEIGWKATLEEAAKRGGVSDRVHWPGIITGNAKWGSFYESEAFILPSHQENFGIAVAESLSCQRPVLLSDQVNIAPEIADFGAGLMEPDTPQGTLDLIERWIRLSPEEKDQMRAKSQHMFRTRYDMRGNARMIISLFELAKKQNRQSQRPR